VATGTNDEITEVTEETQRNQRLCICQTFYVEGDLMVECAACNEWFHPTCLEIDEPIGGWEDFVLKCDHHNQ